MPSSKILVTTAPNAPPCRRLRKRTVAEIKQQEKRAASNRQNAPEALPVRKDGVVVLADEIVDGLEVPAEFFIGSASASQGGAATGSWS